MDHTSVAEFARLPDAAIDAAAALRMVYVDASVGANISDGLDCLSYPSTAEARPSR